MGIKNNVLNSLNRTCHQGVFIDKLCSHHSVLHSLTFNNIYSPSYTRGGTFLSVP